MSKPYTELTTPHQFTRLEYAAIVKQASQRAQEIYTAEYAQANEAMTAWYKANPEPVRTDFDDDKKFYEWKEKVREYDIKRAPVCQKCYNIATLIQQAKRNIELAEIVENGISLDQCNSFEYFGGVNNPMITHGNQVILALYRGIEVPDQVLADYPEMVAQARQDIAERLATA